MSRIDIAFDLDGVLVKIMPVAERVLFERYNAVIPEKRNFTIITEPEISYDELMEVFDEAFSYVDEIPIEEGATELLHKLWASTNEPVKIITARPQWAANNTYQLVEKICPDFPYELIITENKIEHLKYYKYFVDDRRKTAVELAYLGIKVYVPKMSYNQPIDKFTEYKRNNIKMINNIKELIPIAGLFIREDFLKYGL